MGEKVKMHETIIERADVGTLQAVFGMKKIDNYKIVRMFLEDGEELKPYEAMAGRQLTRDDAVVVSTLTQAEVQQIIEGSEDNEELEAFRRQRTKEGIKNYNMHYASDDPICIETIDYFLPDDIDTSSSFTGDYDKLLRDVICDNVTEIARWICCTEETYLEIQTTADAYIGSGVVHNDIVIREMKTRDVVMVLERDESEDRCGFAIVTAYPDITERSRNAVPTGKDMREYVHEAKMYKYGDAAQRRMLDQKALRGITH